MPVDNGAVGFPSSAFILRLIAPESDEAIKHQMLVFTLNGNLPHFSTFRYYIGLYLVSSGIEKFQEERSVSEGGKKEVATRPLFQR